MAESSAIEWTDATWNPVTGCEKVSPGCDHCYAETFAERWRGTAGHHFEQGFDLRLWPDRLTVPLKWRKSKRIFVNSMSDLFHDAVPTSFIDSVFGVMAANAALGRTPHIFQLLTKRHARMRAYLADPQARARVALAGAQYCENGDSAHDYVLYGPAWPLPNLWLGVSVENQKWADIRVPALLATPAAVRFVSAEPLLGPVDLSRYLGIEWSDLGVWLPEMFATLRGDKPGIDWVIAGGESGPRARPMHPDWARGLRDQCQAAEVAFFFKQWGAFAPESDGHQRGGISFIDPRGHSWNRRESLAPPSAVRMRCVGKKAAGRLLDGATWDQFPAGRRLESEVSR